MSSCIERHAMRVLHLPVISLTCIAALTATPAGAQGCRAQQIIASQCTWFALEELERHEVYPAFIRRELARATPGPLHFVVRDGAD